MTERLAEFFWHAEYGVQRTNFSNVRIVYKDEGTAVRIIAIFDFEEKVSLTLEQYQHILEQIENAYKQKGYATVYILSLICTKNMEAVKPFCETGKYIHWVVNTVENRLFIYENQPSSFGVVREQLDRILIGRYDRPQPEYQEPVHTKVPKARRNFFTNRQPNGKRRIRTGIDGIPIMTIALVLINVIIYLLMDLTAETLTVPTLLGDVTEKNIDYLSWGATSYSEIVDGHQFYRLFTAFFLHADWEHLYNNMIVLAVVGYMLETKFGSLRFLIIYLTAGVLANVGSVYYFHSIGDLTVGLGASGAIFGIVGGFLYLVLRYRGRGFDVTRTRFLIFAAVTVYSGFQASENIDNIAHIVGFFIGLATCILLDVFRRNQRTG